MFVSFAVGKATALFAVDVFVQTSTANVHIVSPCARKILMAQVSCASVTPRAQAVETVQAMTVQPAWQQA